MRRIGSGVTRERRQGKPSGATCATPSDCERAVSLPSCELAGRSHLKRHNDAEHFVSIPHGTRGRRRADMSAAIRRHDPENLFGRHANPAPILLHFIVVASRTNLGRAAIGKIAAGGFCIGSSRTRRATYHDPGRDHRLQLRPERPATTARTGQQASRPHSFGISAPVVQFGPIRAHELL